MLKVLRARLHQQHRTMAYPDGPPPALPDRFRGRPVIDTAKCPPDCRACAAACPTEAITFETGAPENSPQRTQSSQSRMKTSSDPVCSVSSVSSVVQPLDRAAEEHSPQSSQSPQSGTQTSSDPVCSVSSVSSVVTPPTIDLGRCLFCTDCLDACPEGAIRFRADHRLAVRQRDDLVVDSAQALRLATALDDKSRRLFGRSLKLRQVSAAGCNACEADTNVLNTVGWDLGRFGISFVASPRHADGLLVTGPVSQNMHLALRKTYDAVPRPKLVIAVGACAIAGGPFRAHSQVHNGVTDLLPVDLFIPGCPPPPLTILDGLLRLLGRLDESRTGAAI